jgi:hypothetical protein
VTFLDLTAISTLGETNYDEKDPLIAHNVIHHGAQYPLVVILPVINAGNASATAANQN